MTARTNIDVGWRNWWRTNVREALHYRAIHWKHAFFGIDDDHLVRYRKESMHKQYGAMSAEQVRSLTEYQIATVDADYQQRSKAITASQERFLSKLEGFIREHGIKSAANIGARVDHYCAHLAPLFPEVQFYSVDFQPNLAHHNSLFPRGDNWHFRSGYPLQLVRDGTVNAELYFFISTSVLMNNAELNQYLDTMSNHARAFAFCEGWSPPAERLDFRVRRPETVPEEKPYCGGRWATYHHNYIAKLERRGYRTTFSGITPDGPGYHCLQLFAVRST